MSPEIYQEVENVVKPESSEQAQEIASKLRENYHSTKLSGNRLDLTAFSKELEIDACEKRDIDSTVTQQLRAVVKAGQEIFGIVEATIIQQTGSEPLIEDAVVITRHNSQGRAEVISTLIRGHGVEHIGRAHQTDLGDEVSREHFSITQDVYGGLIIKDGKSDGSASTNGTEVFEIKPSDKERPNKPDKPWEDFTFWAPESSDVKKAVTKLTFQ